ncbi:DUF1320 domain-containing protein [bacterium]|nr:DUF1320 domain-containing protein [bacterium]
MAYSTLENLKNIIAEEELINLTNDKYPAEEINLEIIASSIEYADEFINSYLRNKYALPLKMTPKIIENLSTDIAAYRLYTRRPRKLPEHIVNNYNEANKILTNLKKGEMILDLPSEHPDKEPITPVQMVVTDKKGSSRIFDEKTWGSFR